MNKVVRDLTILVWFSATSFFHGYLVMAAAYFALPGWVFAVLLALYLATMFAMKPEHSGSWTIPAFRDSFVTQSPLEYFDAAVVGAEQLRTIKGERCLFGFHPHGIYPMAGVLAYAGASPLRKEAPWLRIRPCAASILFKVPLIRECAPHAWTRTARNALC